MFGKTSSVHHLSNIPDILGVVIEEIVTKANKTLGLLKRICIHFRQHFQFIIKVLHAYTYKQNIFKWIEV